MTPFPSLIDQITHAVLAPEQATENPHHRAILDAYIDIQDLDRQLAALAEGNPPAGGTAGEKLDKLTALLIERMAAGAELTDRLSSPCRATPPAVDPSCEADPASAPPCPAPAFEARDRSTDPHQDTCKELPSCRRRPRTIVHACLDICNDVGAVEYVGAAELVARLGGLPGRADARWRYADLTPLRLSLLLRAYGVRPCKPCTGDGRRYRAYRVSDLRAVHPDCSC